MLRTIVCCAVVSSSLPALGQDYRPAAGPHPVRDSGLVTLHDSQREKDLPVRIRYPDVTQEHPGPFPLVVFSHGAGGSCDAFAPLSEFLASNGYVVIHPSHSDSLSLVPRDERRDRSRELLRNPRGIVEKVDLRDRVADVKFILDSLDDVEQLLEQEGLIDREKLAMAGHSAGAMTTQVLGGMEFAVGRRTLKSNLIEPRFDALAVISGAGTTRRSITEDSWRKVDRPWLVLAGSEDVSAASDETPESRRHPYEYAPADGSKYLIFIDGATHSSYQGKGPGMWLDGKAPDNLDWIATTTNLSVLAFFDAYVKGLDEAKEWLDQGASTQREGGTAEFLHK